MKKRIYLILSIVILIICMGSCTNKGSINVLSIDKTLTDGLIDTYTITYSDGNKVTFTVTNGKDGEQGIQGVPGADGHTPVITIKDGYWYVDGINTNVLAEGVKGDNVNGISSIEKTSTNGLVDTYTITFTNGTTTTFTVTNGMDGNQGIQGIQGVPGADGHTPVITIKDGYWYVDGVNTNVLAEGVKGDTGNGISLIEKTSTNGLVDTYTITFTNGTTTTFTVTNGQNGISAYDIYLIHNPDYNKSEEEWLNDLINGELGKKEYHEVLFEDGNGNIINKVLVEHSYKLELPENPVNQGYNFIGWYYNEDKWNFNIYGVLDDMTLIAKWEKADYVINFETNGGDIVQNINYSFGESFKLPPTSKEGYTFEGWYLDSECNGNKITEINKEIFGNLTLYANYTPNKYYITLNFNNGLNYEEKEVYYNHAYNLVIPKKEGYTFVGWYYLDGSTEVKYTDSLGNSLLPYNNIEHIMLHAKYATKTFKVSFDLRGVTTMEDIDVEYLSSYELPTDLLINNRFLEGWYNEDYTIKYTDTIIVREDITLHARWVESIPISTYTELLTVINSPKQNYHLTTDINCEGNSLVPISTYTGIFNGCNFKIYNFVVSHINNLNYGLIINNQGTIKNLNLEGYSINVNVDSINTPATTVNSSILCTNNNGIIDNVNISKGNVVIYANYLNTEWVTTQKVTHTLVYGGITGRNNGKITNSSCNGEYSITLRNEKDYTYYQTIEMYVGGIAGLSYNDIINCSSELKGSYSSWNYVCSSGKAYNYAFIGTITGSNASNIKKCTGDLNINLTTSGSAASGNVRYISSDVGGITGRNSSIIEECYSNCNINGYNIYGNFGGISGNSFSNSTIKNCYSDTIFYTKVNSLGGAINVGGLIGLNNGILSSSYSNVSIQADCTSYTGFLVGNNDVSGSLTNCFALGSIVLTEVSNSSLFADVNNGIVRNCIIQEDSSFKNNALDVIYDFFNTNTHLTKQELLTKDCLLNTLYWTEDVWYIDEVNYPILN